MSDVTSSGNHPAQDPNSVPAKPASNRMQIVVIAVVVVALALLMAYQFFGCVDCYAKPSI